MTYEELLQFCTDHPKAADALLKALRSAAEFRKGRGAMLAALHLDPQVARIVSQLKQDFQK